MSFFIEMPSWVEEVYTLEVNDTLTGGLEGEYNKPYQDLVNRTYYLKTNLVAHLHDSQYLPKAEQILALEGTCLHQGDAYYPNPSVLETESTDINPLVLILLLQAARK